MDPESQPATKADLFAVKSDLSDVKSDLSAAKSELRGEIAAVRSELSASTRRLALEIVGTNARLDRVESSLRDEMTRNTDRIMGAIDDFAKKSEIANNAIVLHSRAITEMQVKLADHDRRLGAVEGRQP